MLFDSHAHINDLKLIDRIEEIIDNALKNEINKIVCVGYDKESSLNAIELANQYDIIYAAIGVHPSEANQFNMDIDWIKDYIDNPKVVAIGEIGLDYYWDKTYKEEQKELFKKQIELANQYKKPFIVHMRDATNDTYELIKSTKNNDISGVMHCYSASKESMQQFIDLGMYISLAGPVTFKNAKTPKEVAKEIPLDKLLVETDCPYLAPTPFRGKVNEPKNVLYIAKEIAKIKDISFEELSKHTYKNTCKLFNIEMKEE
ncbi:TatD family hydrolase [Candidatus Izemoplasma sp. B36]|uniref:TatD family hydrolase n=1 Tax=Candidatus Izemoplasma sp. B36 TaxID=3242468 RepID=UPI003557C2B5